MLGQGALTMLLSVLPATRVEMTIWPVEGSLAALLVIHIVTLIALSIWPRQRAIPMHLVVLPWADV